MQKYQNNVQTLDGRAIVGASVTVTEYPGGAPATVYNANGSGVITQPILTNGDGEFAFYAANGRYQLQITGGGISVAQTITDVILFDPSEAIDASEDAGDLAGDEFVPVSRGSGVLKTTLTAIAQWVLRHWNAAVTPEMYGTTDTPANTAAAFNAAAAACLASGKKLMAGASSYTLGADVNLRKVGLDFSGCTITVNDGFLLTIGGDAGTTINPRQILGDVKRPLAWSLNPADYPVPTLRVMGAKGQTIRGGHVDALQFYQSTNPATYPADASQAYSHFSFDFTTVWTVDTDPAYDGGPGADGPGSANQWFNENTLEFGRFVNGIIRGSYRHNNNRIERGCVETSAGLIRIESGNKNHFEGMRFEAGPSVYFGANTEGNTISVQWYSSAAQIYEQPPVGGTITDLGKDNNVKNMRVPYTDTQCVALASVRDRIHSGQPGNYGFRMATRKAIRGEPRTTARIVLETDAFELEAGDYLFSRVESIDATEARYLMKLYPLDANMNPITPTADMFESAIFTSFFSDSVQGTINSAATHHRLGILSSNIKYGRIALLTTGNATQDYGKTIRVNRVSRRTGRDRQLMLPESAAGWFNQTTSKPTKFVGAIGDLVAGTANDYRCTFYLETTVTAAASGGATSVTVGTLTLTGFGSFALNDLIGFDLDDGTVHWTTVTTGSSGTTVAITAALPSAASIGNKVYISRLADR